MAKAKITVTAKDEGVRSTLKAVSDLEAKIKSLEAQLKAYDNSSVRAAMAQERLKKLTYENASAVDPLLKKQRNMVKAQNDIASASVDLGLKTERLTKLKNENAIQLDASTAKFLKESDAINISAKRESDAINSREKASAAIYKRNIRLEESIAKYLKESDAINASVVKENQALASKQRLSTAYNQTQASLHRVTTAQQQAQAATLRAASANTQAQISAVRLGTAQNQNAVSANRVTISQNQAAISAQRLATAQSQAQIAALRLQNMQNATATATRNHTKSWLQHIATVASGIIVYQGIRSAMHGVLAIFANSIKAVSDYQDALIGTAAMYTTYAKDQSNIAETYRLNKEYAEGLIPVLQKIDQYTAMNLDQLMQVNQALATQGVALNTNNEKQVQGYINIANAILFMTKGQASSRQIAQEVRAIIQGQARASDALGRLLESKLGKNYKEQIQQWKRIGELQGDSGYLLEKIGELLSGFTPASKDMENTWTAVTSSLKTTFDLISREAMGDVLKDWVKYLKQFNQYLRDHKEEIATNVKKAWDDLKEVIAFVYANLDKVKVIIEAIIAVKIIQGLLAMAKAFEAIQITSAALALTLGVDLIVATGGLIVAFGAIMLLIDQLANKTSWLNDRFRALANSWRAFNEVRNGTMSFSEYAVSSPEDLAKRYGSHGATGSWGESVTTQPQHMTAGGLENSIGNTTNAALAEKQLAEERQRLIEQVDKLIGKENFLTKAIHEETEGKTLLAKALKEGVITQDKYAEGVESVNRRMLDAIGAPMDAIIDKYKNVQDSSKKYADSIDDIVEYQNTLAEAYKKNTITQEVFEVAMQKSVDAYNVTIEAQILDIEKVGDKYTELQDDTGGYVKALEDLNEKFANAKVPEVVAAVEKQNQILIDSYNAEIAKKEGLRIANQGSVEANAKLIASLNKVREQGKETADVFNEVTTSLFDAFNISTEGIDLLTTSYERLYAVFNAPDDVDTGDSLTEGIMTGIAGLGQTIGGQLGATLTSTASMALAGLEIGGPIGAAVGGVIGLVSSFFGGDDGKAERDNARREAYNSMLSNAASGGMYSYDLLKAAGVSYESVANYNTPTAIAGKSAGNRLLEDRGEEGVANLTEFLSIMDAATLAVSSFNRTELASTIENLNIVYELNAVRAKELGATEEQLADIQLAAIADLTSAVTGLSATNVAGLISEAITDYSGYDSVGQAFAGKLEGAVATAIMNMQVSNIVNSVYSSALEPMLNEVTAKLLSGTLADGDIAALMDKTRATGQLLVPVIDELNAQFERTGLITRTVAEATEDAVELQNELTQLEKQKADFDRQILELTLSETELRAIDLAAMDASLRPLQERVWILQDEVELTEKAVEAEKELQETRASLEATIFELTHTEAEIRAAQIAALDASLRPLQEHVYALQDEAEAATEAAEAAKTLQQTQNDLETQLFELTHTEAEIRAAQIAAMPETLQGLQAHVYALQDEAKAASDAQAALESAASERYSLETQLLQLQGDTAALRERELALLDPSNRALQQEIWRLEDLQAAMEATTDTVSDSVETLTDTFSGLATSVTDAANSLEALGDATVSLKEARRAMWVGSANQDFLSQIELSRSAVDSLIKQALSDNDSTRIDAMGNLPSAISDYTSSMQTLMTDPREYYYELAKVSGKVENVTTTTLSDVKDAINGLRSDIRAAATNDEEQQEKQQEVLETLEEILRRWNYRWEEEVE